MDKLWYAAPAKLWRNALPLGNGVTGLMVYGGKKRETLAFNDCRLWSGYPKDQNNPDSLVNLNKARKLVFDGKNKQADQLVESKMIGNYCESFLPLGELFIDFKNVKKQSYNQSYRRELDISRAIHSVNYGGIERETLVSYPDKIAVQHIVSKIPMSIVITAKSKMHSQVVIDKGLNLIGNAPDYVAPNYLRTELRPIKYKDGKGMSFCMRAEVSTNGDVEYGKNKIIIKNATEITIYFATATGYVSSFDMPIIDRQYAIDRCKQTLRKLNKNYKNIRSRHIEDYSALYNRQKLSLQSDTDIDTDELMRLAKGGDVKSGLVELFYNYGKYLTISGSRQGGEALNLQGQWNNSMRPPWSSNYTANINAEMNYWGASTSNLADCIEPYINLVYEIMQKGKSTANINYGCSGFACNHNVDIWRKTAPVRGTSSYMYAPLCGVWLANELYEHFRYGKLNRYEDKIKEIMTEATKFVCDYLVMFEGQYVTAPSASPEASFKGDGGNSCLDYASAFEMGIAKQALVNLLEFCCDDKLRSNAEDKLSKLYPFSCGKTGINEWHTDYNITEKGHRHFSPLYAFYPAKVIKYYGNETEREWVKQLFHYRIDHCTWFIGWSGAWSICLAARLHEEDTAIRIIDNMLSKSVFDNLFNIHPPFLFQIDGNFGYVAGINEMLIYQENGVVELLPALPKKWSKGEVKGLVTYSGEISFEWSGSKLVSVTADKATKICSKYIDSNTKLSNNITVVRGCYEQ